MSLEFAVIDFDGSAPASRLPLTEELRVYDFTYDVTREGDWGEGTWLTVSAHWRGVPLTTRKRYAVQLYELHQYSLPRAWVTWRPDDPLRPQPTVRSQLRSRM